MINYMLTIDSILSCDPYALACIIPTMKRAQGLLGTLEVPADCQMLPILGVLTII
jgi:hypothetical protein